MEKKPIKEKKGGKAMSASTDERAVELMAQADPDCCCCKYHKSGFCGKFNDEAAADFECVMWGFAHWEGDLDCFRILAEYGDEEDGE